MSIEEVTQVSLFQSKVGIKVIFVHFPDTSILIHHDDTFTCAHSLHTLVYEIS
jgi:hypothetical protein